jgi:glycosyltransferase involved in cell wall biosynthesis
MQPIRVLQVFTILNRGGAEANIMNYYRNIDTTKIHFDFLVHRQEEGVFEKEIEQLGGKVFRLPAVNPLNLKDYKKAVKDFFDSHPDYQIVHGQLSELGVFIYEEAKKRKIPIIIAHAHNSKMSWDIKAPFRFWWKSRMKKSINTYFTCGIDSAKWLFGEKLAEKAYSMNNAVSVSKFQFKPEIRQKLRTDLGSENTINIVNVARFNKQKNHIFLLEVFAEVLKQKSNYHLYLVGEGGLKEDIINKIDELGIKEKVTLLGVRNDVEILLQAMDIYFFPSLFEGLPVSLIEAQASGIKCIISDGIPEEAVLVNDNVEVISLQKPKEFWAERIIENSTYERKDVSDIIKQKGYDIAENAKSLEIKYTELLQNLS